MTRTQLLYLTVLLLFFGACDYYDHRLQIQNNSDHEITYFTSIDTIMDIDQLNINHIDVYIGKKIVPGVTINSTKIGSTQAWPFFIRKSVNEKLNIFFFSVDTLLKYNDWGIIKKLNLYEMYSFTEEELEQSNWLIDYP